MSPAPPRVRLDDVVAALADVPRRLPHLRDLAFAASVVPIDGLGSVCVDLSARIFYDPAFMASLDREARTFVLAHELEHVRLRTFERATLAPASRGAFNIAHDFVINDRLRDRLGCDVPAKGLRMEGARWLCAEDLLDEARRTERFMDDVAGIDDASGHVRSPEACAALLEARANEARTPSDASMQFPPDYRAPRGAELTKVVVDDATSDEDLDAIREIIQRYTDLWGALGRYRLPSELRRAEPIVPAPWAHRDFRGDEARRTYSTPSRRRVAGTDGLVFAGRRRVVETWCVVLDVSCSVIGLPRAVATLHVDAKARGVERVRVVQCDGDVVADEVLDIDALPALSIAGRFGTEVLALLEDCRSCANRHAYRLPWVRTDLAPAFRRLEASGVRGDVLVVTDGYVEIPPSAPSFDPVFAVEATNTTFRAPYGERVDFAVR